MSLSSIRNRKWCVGRLVKDFRERVMRVFQARGEARTSFVSKLLEDGCTPEKEDVVKWAALSLYSGECLCLFV